MKPFYLFALLLVMAINMTNAQMSGLDSTFGTNGHVELGQNFTATSFQNDGKLVGIRNEGSQLLVYQYLPNGSPNPAFGNGGVAVVQSLPADARALSVAVGIDGKIVILNSMNRADSFSRAALVRLNANGAIDPTLGTNGIAINNLGFKTEINIPNKVAVASNGEIFVTFGTHRTVLARYSISGKLIVESVAMPNAILVSQYDAHVPTDLLILRDGKILIGGFAYKQFNFGFGPRAESTIVRFNSDGTFDYRFGFESIYMGIAFGLEKDTVKSVGVNNLTGTIATLGTANRLLSYTDDGAKKRSAFGGVDGVNVAIRANKIVIQSNGEIITGGSVNGDFAIASYDSTGKLDQRFGNAGIITSDFGGIESISDMALVGERLYTYGSGKLAAYIIADTSTTEPPADSSAIVNTNTKSGSGALQNNTSGAANTAYGYNALQANTTGTGNTGIGYNALFANATGLNNTATGGAAMASNTTGSNNVAYGVGAGFSQNNNSSTFVGTFADATIAVTNSTAVGYRATVNASNQVRIGNSAVTSIGGFTNWTNLSDGRFKKNITEDVPGLAFISLLRPVTYNLDLEGIDTRLKTNFGRQGASTKALSILPPTAEELQAKVEKAKVRYTGFVAQEVEQAAKKLGYDFSGVDVPKEKEGYYGLRYAEFVVPLVKAVQEQQKQIEELKELVSKLSGGATTNNTTIQLSSTWLEQNFPNPHSGNTVVRYHLPERTGNAQIVITNMKGQVIRSVTLNNRGDGQVTINAATLSAGTYNYSLWVGGKEVDTKRMVVAR
jgi:uncharacterized delta-60 repeat protein